MTGSYGFSFVFSSPLRAKSAADLAKASATSSSEIPKFVRYRNPLSVQVSLMCAAQDSCAAVGSSPTTTPSSDMNAEKSTVGRDGAMVPGTGHRTLATLRSERSPDLVFALGTSEDELTQVF